MKKENPIKPYLIKAVYDWIIDNNQTPYIEVFTNINGVEVPQDYVTNDSITLNLNPSACGNLNLGKDITFRTRFRGIDTFVRVPYNAITAIYGKESKRGMFFKVEESEEESQEQQEKQTKPDLKVVDGLIKKDHEPVGLKGMKKREIPSYLKIIK
jgi:stringent starvation protein B